MFKLFKRETAKENEKLEASILDNIKLEYEDIDGTPASQIFKKVRQRMDIDKYKQIKRALRLKKNKMFYSTEKQIANKLGVSETTVGLVRKSKSFKNYKELRTQESRK